MRQAAALTAVLTVLALASPGRGHAQTAGSPDTARAQESPALDPQDHQDHAPDDATTPGEDRHRTEAPTEPLTPIPPLTDADRAAAFPEVEPHRMGDSAIHTFALLDQLEWQGGEPASGGKWDAKGWIGGDRNRLRVRSEGHTDDGRLENAEIHLLFGRAVSRWWDLVAGVRQNVRPGPAQTWVAFGVQGLARYWFEVEATGYVSDQGQTALRLEADYELLFTNRLVVRPLIEIDVHGKSDPARKVGAGLSDLDLGLRVRYELRREVAPYIGVSWHNSFGETRSLARAAGDGVSGLRVVTGIRLWY